jgi:hypothetical protein
MATDTLALSVDVDDLILANCDFFGLPYRDHRTNIRSEMRCLADILDRHGARCTFFVPGYILEARPDTLDDVLDRGHEIACHGHRHVPVYRHSPAEFEDDLGTAVDLIRRATGVTPSGYRAPGMTLVPVAGWATPLLQSHGFRYSSSVPGLALGQHKFRSKGPRPFRWPCGLLEMPVSAQDVWGLRVPVCGSVYTRLLPHTLVQYATETFRRRSAFPLFYYLHPFEVFPESLPGHILARHWRLRLYAAGCRGFEERLRWVLDSFKSVTAYGDAFEMVSPAIGPSPVARGGNGEAHGRVITDGRDQAGEGLRHSKRFETQRVRDTSDPEGSSRELSHG